MAISFSKWTDRQVISFFESSSEAAQVPGLRARYEEAVGRRASREQEALEKNPAVVAAVSFADSAADPQSRDQAIETLSQLIRDMDVPQCLKAGEYGLLATRQRLLDRKVQGLRDRMSRALDEAEAILADPAGEGRRLRRHGDRRGAADVAAQAVKAALGQFGDARWRLVSGGHLTRAAFEAGAGGMEAANQILADLAARANAVRYGLGALCAEVSARKADPAEKARAQADRRVRQLARVAAQPQGMGGSKPAPGHSKAGKRAASDPNRGGK